MAHVIIALLTVMSDYQKYITNDGTTDNSRMREVHE